MKNTITWIIIVLVALFILNSKGCLNGDNQQKGPDTLRIVDTTWLKHDSIIYRKQVVNHEVLVPVASKPEYLPDPEYPKLKAQYEALAAQHLAKRIYKDSVAVGKFGYIYVTDTVQENKLLTRKFRENYSIPVVKETMTITKYADPVRQVYVGGGINAAGLNAVKGVEAGILYKSKNDQIVGATYNVNIDGTTSFGIKYYTKIQFKRKK